jgi:uncharacterized protein (DUF2164 family)
LKPCTFIAICLELKKVGYSTRLLPWLSIGLVTNLTLLQYLKYGKNICPTEAVILFLGIFPFFKLKFFIKDFGPKFYNQNLDNFTAKKMLLTNVDDFLEKMTGLIQADPFKVSVFLGFGFRQQSFAILGKKISKFRT